MSQREIGERPSTMMFLTVVGWLAIVSGVLAILAGFANQSPESAVAGAGLLFSSLGFFALAKIIDLLCEIADKSSKIT